MLEFSLVCFENARALRNEEVQVFGVPFSRSLTAPSRQGDYIICTETLLPKEGVKAQPTSFSCNGAFLCGCALEIKDGYLWLSANPTF